MKVYGHPISTCTRKVLMTLAEKNHAYELIIVDITKNEQKQPQHLLRHPFGVIPVLEDEDFLLYEARAIIRYLDSKLQGLTLTPTDLHARGLMEQWISVEQSYFCEPAIVLAKQLYLGRLHGLEPDMDKVNHAKERVAHIFEIIEKNLHNQPYLAGLEFSLADICWMPYVDYLFAAGVGELVQQHPRLSAWWQTVSLRPAWQIATAKT